MSHDNDPISVTAYLRDLVRVFVESALEGGLNLDNRTEIHYAKELKAVDDCFQLFLGRDPTDDERRRISPW